MANPSTQVPSLQQLGLTAHLPSPEDALKSLQGNNSLPPGWNTAAQQAALPRPPPLPSPDVGFASTMLPPQQPAMMARPDPNAALAGLLHGTIAPSLIPNPAQFLLRNFGIDITGTRPRWVGLNHLRGGAFPTQAPPAPAAASRNSYAPAPLTQFLHSDQQHQARAESMMSSHLTAPAAPRPFKSQGPPDLKRKEHGSAHEHPTSKRQTHAQAMAPPPGGVEEAASDWVPPATGRDPFHERVGSIPLVDLRAQPMSYLQDFMAQVIRDAGKTPQPTMVTAHAPPQTNASASSVFAPLPPPPPVAPPPTAASSTNGSSSPTMPPVVVAPIAPASTAIQPTSLSDGAVRAAPVAASDSKVDAKAQS